MKRRTFLQVGCAATAAVGIVPRSARARIPAHNWDGYNFGAGPTVKERLYQGPFAQYAPEAYIPGGYVVASTTPSNEVVPNSGMGLITYVCDEAGPPKVAGESLEVSIEKLAKMPIGDKLYLRVDWREIQQQPGRLDFPDYWKLTFEMAERYGKKVCFRIQLMSPDIGPPSCPDFVAEKTPFVRLGTTDEIGIPEKVHFAPRYDNPAFMSAFKEMDDLLSDLYNGHSLVEYVDTCMYGFWGEGHTWPFEGNPFPDDLTAENTFIEMFEHQLANWDKTPLSTNTQPDWSRVGNSEILDRTVRSGNWLRTDTIYIENTQIDALSNRPPWIGATIEQGISDGTPETMDVRDGIPGNESVIAHVKDLGANYFSLWNWHRISADKILRYYRQYPDSIDDLARSIGYRVRPSWIWAFDKEGYPGLVMGFVNDGIAGVPGVLRVTVFNDDGGVNVGGGLDPGYPHPHKVRQGMFMLPKGTDWRGLKVRAEIEVKDQRFPVRWACREALEADGSLRLQEGHA
jgi:hypothetical protein